MSKHLQEHYSVVTKTVRDMGISRFEILANGAYLIEELVEDINTTEEILDSLEKDSPMYLNVKAKLEMFKRLEEALDFVDELTYLIEEGD